MIVVKMLFDNLISYFIISFIG